MSIVYYARQESYRYNKRSSWYNEVFYYEKPNEEKKL